MAKHAVAKIVARDITQDESFASWGVQREWAELLPLAWKSIGSDTFSIAYTPKAHTSMAWWFMPLHLLGVGLGWTDIARGLETWRLEGYPTIHPILRLVYQSHGPSIEALEIWLKCSGHEIVDALRFVCRTDEHMAEPLFFSSSNDFEQARHNYETRIQGARTQAGLNNLLNGGYDPQHLGHHFYHALVDCKSGYDAFTNPVVTAETPQHIAFVTVPSMKGLLDFLTTHTPELTGHISMGGWWNTLLTIRDLGLTMYWQYSVSSNRWFLAEGPEYFQEGQQAHNWGNGKK